LDLTADPLNFSIEEYECVDKAPGKKKIPLSFSKETRHCFTIIVALLCEELEVLCKQVPSNLERKSDIIACILSECKTPHNVHRLILNQNTEVPRLYGHFNIKEMLHSALRLYSNNFYLNECFVHYLAVFLDTLIYNTLIRQEFEKIKVINTNVMKCYVLTTFKSDLDSENRDLVELNKLFDKHIELMLLAKKSKGDRDNAKDDVKDDKDDEDVRPKKGSNKSKKKKVVQPQSESDDEPVEPSDFDNVDYDAVDHHDVQYEDDDDDEYVAPTKTKKSSKSSDKKSKRK
jgi:hypothetical protein